MEWKEKAPEWKNEGVEPMKEIKEKGFVAGYKPPASFFNWFWNRVSNCIKEIQEKLGVVEENTKELEGNKADKSIQKEITLLPGQWIGDTAPYHYTIPLPEATEENIIEVLPQGVLPDNVYQAMANADIEEGIQAVGSITLYARGVKPTIELPILIIIRGD